MRTARSALLALAALTPAAAAAQPATPHVREAEPGLLKRATITPGAATRTALRQVANGAVREAEIERERGRLVYAYDIKVPGTSGMDEVLVDAKTGAIVSHTHERPAAEAAEARQDAHTARKTHRMLRAPTGQAATPDRP